MYEMSVSEWTDKIIEPKEINYKTLDGSNYQCVLTPLSGKTEFLTHVYNRQGEYDFNLPVDGKINIAFQVKNNEGFLTPIGVAGLDIRGDVLVVNMIQRVNVTVPDKDSIEETYQIDGGKKIEFGILESKVEHPMKNLMQGKDKIPWQKMLLNEAEDVARQNGLKSIRLISGFSSRHVPTGHSLSLAVTEYDKLVTGEQEWIPFNLNGEEIAEENRTKIINVIRRIKEGKIKDLEQATTALGMSMPAYWEKKLF